MMIFPLKRLKLPMKLISNFNLIKLLSIRNREKHTCVVRLDKMGELTEMTQGIIIQKKKINAPK